jgi:aspartate aminotransferase
VLGRHCDALLRDAGCGLPSLDGAFYLFPDFGAHRERLASRGVTDSASLAECLLEQTGVAALPGHAFGRPREELTLRLSYVNFDGGSALDAAASGETVDLGFVRRHCPDTVAAFERIAAWLD